nr:PREDICTED: uncharacterized protein LOC105083208 [Camelus bactrianus]
MGVSQSSFLAWGRLLAVQPAVHRHQEQGPGLSPVGTNSQVPLGGVLQLEGRITWEVVKVPMAITMEPRPPVQPRAHHTSASRDQFQCDARSVGAASEAASSLQGSDVRSEQVRSPVGLQRLLLLVATVALASSAVHAWGTPKVVRKFQDIPKSYVYVQQAVWFAMKEYNKASSDKFAFKVVEILKSQEQITDSLDYLIEAKIVRTTCKKVSGEHENCSEQQDPQMQKMFYCTFIVASKPWNFELKLQKKEWPCGGLAGVTSPEVADSDSEGTDPSEDTGLRDQLEDTAPFVPRL